MPVQLLLLLIPLVALQIALQAFALRDLTGRQQVIGGNKWVWAAAILLGGLVGAITYLLVARKEA